MICLSTATRGESLILKQKFEYVDCGCALEGDPRSSGYVSYVKLLYKDALWPRMKAKAITVLKFHAFKQKHCESIM